MSSGIEKHFIRFLAYMEHHKMIQPGDNFLLAVSGGMDSCYMTELFARSGYPFSIAHCNFTLRGKESDEEELFVKQFSEKLNKPFHSRRFDTKIFAEENKLSVQEAARELRYTWFLQLCDEFKYTRIATAHHLDDSIETFFINLLRGTGPAGLRGIPPVNEKVIRPIIFLTRTEIEEAVQEKQLSFRTDSSNDSDDYLRNRIRHHLIPILKENSQAFENNMQKLMHEMSFIHSFTMSVLDAWKKKNVKEEPQIGLLIPIRVLRKEIDPASFLSLLLYSYGIKGADSTSILRSEMPGKIFYFGEAEILRDRLHLILRKKETEVPGEITVTKLPAEIQSGRWKIKIHEEEQNDRKRPEENTEFQFVTGDELSLPLTLRTWKAGDYFFPLGMKGKKKLSDFYTDVKLNRFEKDKTLILLSGKNIVCILGHRIDDRYKVTPTTNKILAIEFTRL